MGINSALSLLFRSVSDIHTLRSVRRKKLLNMPENVSAVYRNFEHSKRSTFERYKLRLLKDINGFC